MALVSRTEPIYVEDGGEPIPYTREMLAADVTEAAGGVEEITGPAGRDGADGVGVPTGGTTGQALVKTSGTNFATGWATLTAATITDATAVGRNVLTAADAAAARSAIGAGTSSLTLGTTSSTALRGDTALLQLGTTSTTALRGDYVPPADAAAGTASMRRLGTGSTDAAAGNDSRLSDQRTPTDGSVTAAKVAGALKPSGTAATTDEALRRLGTGAGEAAPGTLAVSAAGSASNPHTNAAAARNSSLPTNWWRTSTEPTNRASGDIWIRTA